jgi:predicted dehydrogenase
MIKVGVIGLGKMGMLHLKICKLIEDVKVVAVSDVSKERLRWAKRLGVKQLFSNYEDLLKHADVDAVIVATPNFTHLHVIRAAAEANKDIFVEKPLARSVAECKIIADIIKKSGIKLMVGHNYRFFDSVKRVREEYEKGAIGDVEIATLELVINGPFAPSLEPTPVPEWYFDKESIGMGCLDSGYHLIDLFQWFFGEADVLYAFLGNRYNLPYEDHAIVVLCSKGRTTKGILNVGWFSKTIFPNFNFRLILHGTAGFLSTDHFAPKNLYLHAIKEGVKNVLRKMIGKGVYPLRYTFYYASYVEELVHFFDCIKSGSDPIVTIEDAIKTINIIERIYQKFGGSPR